MKICLLFLTCMLAEMRAETYFFIDQYVALERMEEKKVTPQTSFWIQQDLGEKSKFGLFSYLETTQDYKLAEGGISFRPASWLQIGGGGGVENVGSKERAVAFGILSHNKDFAFATVENGGSGRWHLAFYTRSIGRFGIGAMTQEFLGAGPRTEINFGPIKLWSTVFFEPSGHNFMFGVRYTYSRP